VKQHQPALSRLSGLVKKKEREKNKKKPTKQTFSLTSLFSCIFSLIAIAILIHKPLLQTKSFSFTFLFTSVSGSSQ
jgi:hypothetical protein